MELLHPVLNTVADAYHDSLLAPGLRREFAHHFAHVAPESWLAMRLAFLVNTRSAELGLHGWSALLERRRVDVTLVPPNAGLSGELGTNAHYIELKLVGTDWWNTVWLDVLKDLETSIVSTQSRKPIASVVVCFLYNVISSPVQSRRKSTEVKYLEYMSRVPKTSGEFDPLQNGQKFSLLKTSAEFELEWPRPVYEKWPNGFNAVMRILWIGRSQFQHR